MNNYWFLYILRCSDNSLYTGITNNLQKRIKKHNQGYGSKYLLGKRPVKLIYSEKYKDQFLARKREVQIKKWRKEKKELLIKGFPRHHSLDKARDKSE
ncbi:MAG TPA: GIY-YIG nuclease family protein [Patescibacteria group bacterium]|nr:GIY-YIG nuclease family protein [Patescibacteria group bacterium]